LPPTKERRWKAKCAMLDWLIGWCLTPTLALFQPYRGVNKCYINFKTHTRPFREIKHLVFEILKEIDLYTKHIVR
jgi:hypothetical protein